MKKLSLGNNQSEKYQILKEMVNLEKIKFCAD